MSNFDSLWKAFRGSDEVFITVKENTVLNYNAAGEELLMGQKLHDDSNMFTLSQVSPPNQQDGKASEELESELMHHAAEYGYARHQWDIKNPEGKVRTMDLTILYPVPGDPKTYYLIMKDNDNSKELMEEHQSEIRKYIEEIHTHREAIESQKEMIETQRDVAIKQRDEITAQKKEITSSIEYAKRIQSALLPTEKMFTQYFQDHFILYNPKDIVSGDFYWITHKNNMTILAAADCTGHGVPGGFMSIMGIAFLNEIVDSLGIVRPGEILDIMRERVIRTLSQGENRGQAKDGMDISVIAYESANNKLQYAGAFNPLFIVREGSLIEFAADRMPIGYFFNLNKSFKNNEITVQPQDSVYLFSDGYADQFGWRNNSKYKIKQFRQLLLDIQHVPMKAQKVLLENDLANWKGDLPQVDDIMVIGIQL